MLFSYSGRPQPVDANLGCVTSKLIFFLGGWLRRSTFRSAAVQEFDLVVQPRQHSLVLCQLAVRHAATQSSRAGRVPDESPGPHLQMTDRRS